MLASETNEVPSTDNNQENVIKIRRINIYDSPILTVSKGNNQVHLVLDTGATASLISLEKAK